MDKDGSGTIEIKELITGLRRSDRSAARLDSAEPFIAGIGEPPGPQMAGGFFRGRRRLHPPPSASSALLGIRSRSSSSSRMAGLARPIRRWRGL